MKFRITAVLLIVAATGLEANAQQRSEDRADASYIYKDNFDELFDQIAIVESEEYKKAEPEQREQMLEDSFLKKKLARVVSAAKWAIGSMVTGTVTFISVYTLKTYGYITLPGLPNINPIIVASSGLSGTLFSLAFFHQQLSAVSGWITNTVKNTASAISQYVSGTTADTLESYERRYVRKKPNLPSQFRKSIEDAIYMARTADPNRHYGSNDMAKIAPDLIESALALPTRIQETSYDRKAIDKIFHCYSDETKKELRRLIVRHVAGNSGEISAQKHAVLFKGPPGTGKSRAGNILAQLLGVPFEEISLADVNREQFAGSRKQDYLGPGLFAEAVIRASQKSKGVKNFVLMVEEADRVLNQAKSEEMSGLPNYMLVFLDPSKHSYYNEFFKANIDITDITVILSGNYDIKDEALKNRVHVINFEKISDECKREIVWDQYFPEIFGRYINSKFALNSEDFTQADRDRFDEVIENDLDPGMRSIYRELEHYIADMIIDKIEEKYIAEQNAVAQQPQEVAP